MTQPGPPLEPGVPVCPRHPDRESYVRCQRCGRPVCPQCQRPAAVGVHCVDCVRESAAGGREARTTFGGRPGDGRPVVTWVIIGLNVLAYLAQRASGTVTYDLGFAPVLAADEPWRFLTAAFLHSPAVVFHILFNMYALWLIGPYLEAQLGRARFAVLYLLAAFGGSVGYLLLADPRTLTVGASGAVFGLFGALVVVQRRLGRELGQILAVIALNTVLGFVVAGIAWQAHLGGLVTGAVAAAVLAYVPRHQRTAFQVIGLLAVTGLLVLASVLGLAAI